MDREMISSKVFWHRYTLAHGRCKNWYFLTIKMFNELGMGFLTNENECVDKHSIFGKCFSMLRFGTAPLRIETGRYERLPVE